MLFSSLEVIKERKYFHTVDLNTFKIQWNCRSSKSLSLRKMLMWLKNYLRGAEGMDHEQLNSIVFGNYSWSAIQSFSICLFHEEVHGTLHELFGMWLANTFFVMVPASKF
jgi:hypothetical protein